MSEPEELRSGERVGKFIVGKHLGAGGMGTVYEARDPELSRSVAIKLVRNRDAHPVRLLREAQALARISHPNVVGVYELGNHGEDVFVAMELIDGVTIDKYIAERKAGWQEILALYLQAGRGLCAVHEQGLVHRDVKPSNILVDHEGRVRIGDFGLARRDDGRETDTISAEERQVRAAAETVDGKVAVSRDSGERPPGGALDADITAQGSVVGTPRYMAPEQVSGSRVTRQADQYSFALALWEAIYGELPNEVEREAPAGSKVPAWLERTLVRALHRDPLARWPSMAALVDELERAPRRRRRLVVAGGSALAVAATAGVLVATGAFSRGPKVDCTRAGDPVAAAWTAEMRGSVASGFGALGPTWAKAGDPALVELDRWSARATAERIEACRATHERGTQTAELLDKRVTCLDGEQAVFDALVRTLAKTDRAGAEHALIAAERLPAPETCTAARLVDATVAASDPAVAEATVAVELQRADAKDLTEKLLVSTASAAPAIRARAHLLRGRVLAPKEPMLARADLDAALADAAAARDPGLEAEIMLAMLTIAAGSESSDRVDALIPVVRAAVTRAGEPRPLARQLAMAEMGAYARLGRAEPARAACARAVPLGDGRRVELDTTSCACRLALVLREPEEVPACTRALDVARKAYGDKHPLTLDLVHDLGTALMRRRKLDEAETLVRGNVEAMSALYGRDSVNVVSELQLLSVVQDRQDKVAESRATLEEALAISDRVSGKDSAQRAGLLLELADRALQQKDKAAIKFADEGLAAAEAWMGTEHRDLAVVLLTHGKALELDPALLPRAKSSFQRAVAIADKTAGPQSYVLASVLEHYAFFLTRHDMLAESVEPAKRSAEMFGALGEVREAASLHSTLGEIYMELKRPEDARASFTTSRSLYVSLGDKGAKGVAEVDGFLAKLK